MLLWNVFCEGGGVLHCEVAVELEVDVYVLSQSQQWLALRWACVKCLVEIESGFGGSALDPNGARVGVGGVEGTKVCRGESEHRKYSGKQHLSKHHVWFVEIDEGMRGCCGMFRKIEALAPALWWPRLPFLQTRIRDLISNYADLRRTPTYIILW